MLAEKSISKVLDLLVLNWTHLGFTSVELDKLWVYYY